MSLINDALKRAEADKPRRTQSDAQVPPLQPVEAPSGTKSSPLLLGGILLLGIGTVGIAAALWFNGRATPENKQTTSAPVQQPTAIQSPAPVIPQQATAVPTVQPSPVIQASQTVAVTQSAPAVAAPSTLAPAPQPQRTPPQKTPVASQSPTASAAAQTGNPTAKPIRLQSIFYRLRSPTVIINGKTLGIGDSVDGIKVVSIQRTSVEVQQNGKYRTLTLQD